MNVLPDTAEQSSAFTDDSGLLPRRFGRYELAYRVATGGFAHVHLGRARGAGAFEKFVALKRIHPHHAERTDFVAMFLDEARIASSIDHPNVCSAFDSGKVDGELYLAMDYLVGEPLSRVMRTMATRPMRRDDRLAMAIAVVSAAAEGLHAAHEAVGPDGAPLSVVHRDVAPPNVFVRYDGHVQVMDFGCATAAGRLCHTATGIAKGHIQYLSPEQLRGERADRRVDIWALGVILWELVTGKRLFERQTPQASMYAIVRDKIPSARRADRGIPREIDQIVMRALTRDRVNRYATARDLVNDLRAFATLAGLQTTGSAVATRMERIFPFGKDEKLRLLESARVRLDECFGPIDGAVPSSGVRLRPSMPDGVAAASGEGPSDEDEIATRLMPVDQGDGPEEPAAVLVATPPQSTRYGSLRIRGRVRVAGFAMLAAVGGIVAGWGARATVPAVDAPRASASARHLSEATARARVRSQRVRLVTPVRPLRRAGSEPARMAAPMRPHVRRMGRVNVVTPGGWADVFEGGSALGPTPVQLELAAGLHRLRLVAAGGTERTVAVRVRPDEVVPLVVAIDTAGVETRAEGDQVVATQTE